MANDQGKPAAEYVIHRTSETTSEWWTGSNWSEDEHQALRYSYEPDVSVETLDESAKAEKVERLESVPPFIAESWNEGVEG